MEPSNSRSSQMCTMKTDLSVENSGETNFSLDVEDNGETNAGTSEASYEFVQVSLAEMSGEEPGTSRQLYFTQNELESYSASMPSLQQNYRYAIDNLTGNLLIIQDSTDSNIMQGISSSTEIPSSSGISLSGDPYALLQVLSDRHSHSVLDSHSEEHITFHSAEDIEYDDDIGTPVDNSHQIQIEQPNEAPIRRALWSRRKIADFIQCIHNHEQRFRKHSKIKGSIWNDISKDMLKLGHSDCNKDECSKKWNNLYRTWKKVKLRPKEDRFKWQYFQQISTLVKAISQRDSDKSKKSSKKSIQELMLQLMEQSQKHQASIYSAEETFQAQVLRLDKERDDILHEIRTILAA